MQCAWHWGPLAPGLQVWGKPGTACRHHHVAEAAAEGGGSVSGGPCGRLVTCPTVTCATWQEQCAGHLAQAGLFSGNGEERARLGGFDLLL